MRTLRRMVWIIVLVIALGFLFPFSYANASAPDQGNTNEPSVGVSSDQSLSYQGAHADTDERNNFDIASLLSLLGNL